MNFSFTDALDALGANAGFMVANAARPPAAYLFNTILPERPEYDYTVKSGTMTVRATMAGLVGMDSPYPPGGIVEMSTFLEEAAKIANETTLTENALRRMQQIVRDLMLSGMPTNDFLQGEILNFTQKVIIQAHLDAFEWLRGQALVTGAIDWTFNGKNLVVDYGVPAANLLTQRTSTAAWDSTASAFWTDVRLLQQRLRYNVRAFIIHPDTLNAVLANDVNKIEILRQETLAAGAERFAIRRLVGDNDRPATDRRDNIELIAYGLEGEIADLSNPGQTTTVPFMPKKKLLAVANNTRGGYRVGEGSTDDPVQDMALGYTHLAPTVEGGGRPGRWARVFTPEGAPWQLVGQGVSNGLPVIEVPEKIAVASSQIDGA